MLFREGVYSMKLFSYQLMVLVSLLLSKDTYLYVNTKKVIKSVTKMGGRDGVALHFNKHLEIFGT